jgi:tetratricopeptide (TPR) repeat protein
MRYIISFIILLHSVPVFSQFGLDHIKNKLKEKGDEVVEEAKNRGKNKFQESLDNARKDFDESNFNYAISFIDNSGTFENKEKGSTIGNTVANAKSLYEGNDISDEDKAYAHNHSGELLLATNKYQAAEQNFKSSKFFYEKAGVNSGLNYAQVISNLGLLYQSTGRYTKARSFINAALDLRENSDNKAMVVVSLNNKGVLLKDMGEYIEAEKCFNAAIAILKELNNDLSFALVYNNLAMVHADMAKLSLAESDMRSSLQYAAKILKDNSSNFIKLQVNQANIFRLQKKYTESENLYLKAISIKEKKLGAHPDLAQLKRGLAGLYMEMNKPQEVGNLLQSAVDIDKRKLGESHPSTLAAIQDLGNYYRYANDNAKASALLTEVVQKKKTIYGANHPNYIQALEDLALTQWQGNLVAEANSNYDTVISRTLNYIVNYFNSLNENEKTLYWERTTGRLHRYYSFILSNYTKQPKLLQSFYNTLIATKGFLLNTSLKIRSNIASSENPELQQAYSEWLETKESLNNAYQLSKEELNEERVNIDSLNARVDELERVLSEKSYLFKDQKEEPVYDFVKVSQAGSRCGDR